jgi:D-sedoheptulose 7-phosphate isomerase
MTELIESYFREVKHLASATRVTNAKGEGVALPQGIAWAVEQARETHRRGNKLMVIGNGGSAAIASHLATDYTKNGGIRTQAFNDGAMLTCLGNDLGYENVFAKQIAMFARAGDLLLAISSSGRSANILNGVGAARDAQCQVLTLSGFAPQNPLRGLGDINFYIASAQYGFVEILHLTLCHAILDILMGWQPSALPSPLAGESATQREALGG